MPKSRRKRYIPVTIDINDDAEVWDLTDLFGDRALRVWLEVLSILEKSGNRWPDTKKGWEAVFRKCRVYGKNGWKIRDKLLTNRWLMVHQGFVGDLSAVLGSPNFWKYHTYECKELDFTWSLLTIPILSDSYKNKNPDAPSADFLKTDKKKGGDYMSRSQNLIPELKEQTDRLYNSDREKFQRLIIWVAQGRKHGYLETDMAEALRQFWDYRVIDEWYAYLDTILDKVVKDRNMRESGEEHRRHLREIEELGNSARNWGGPKVEQVLSVVRGVSEAKGVK